MDMVHKKRTYLTNQSEWVKTTKTNWGHKEESIAESKKRQEAVEKHVHLSS